MNKGYKATVDLANLMGGPLDQPLALARFIIENALDGVITIGPNGEIHFLNPAAERIFGYTVVELTGCNIEVLMPAFYRAEQDGFHILKHDGEGKAYGRTLEVTGVRKDGSTLAVEFAVSEFDLDGRRLTALILRDITGRKQMEESLWESEVRHRMLTENTYDLLGELSNDGHYLYLSPNCVEILGYQSEELLGRAVADFVHPEDRKAITTELSRLVDHSVLGRTVYRFMHKNGEVRWFESTGKTYKTITGEVRAVFVSRDITERQRYEEMIWRQAFYDALTGLPNRMLFSDRLTLAMAHARRNKRTLAVLHLDLDRFQLINDTLGHAAGDELLQKVAARLAGCVREDDSVARLGSDEFALLLPNIAQAENAAKVAEKIIQMIRQPLTVSNQELFVSAGIGIALYPGDGEDAESLLKSAHMAMCRAKEKGCSNCQLYTATMNAKAFERLSMENSLRRALERGEFTVYYQPKVRVSTGQIVGLEALARWQHPERGLVLPGEFIPLAEETGLIVPLGDWVLRSACAQNKAWQEAGLPPVSVAVNLSARQFQLQDLVETVSRVLRETGLAARWLELEITESVTMQNVEHTIEVLQELRNMGIKLSIDDFGTGYSSLGYLKRFPIDKLKIDKSFVHEIGQGRDNAIIATTVIVLGRSLRLGVIAEGVETKEQAEFLKRHRCQEAQGYLFGKPMPAEEVEKLLAEQRLLFA